MKELSELRGIDSEILEIFEKNSGRDGTTQYNPRKVSNGLGMS